MKGKEVRYGHDARKPAKKKNPSPNEKDDILGFSFFLSCYIDDAAFVLLSREDAEKATALIVKHFAKFGLTIHVGNRVAG